MKTLKLTEEQVNRICTPLFKDIQQKHFQVCKTKGGNVAIVFSRCAGGEYPLLGAYYTSDDDEDGEWMASKWSAEGRFNSKAFSLLDLMSVLPIDAEVY
jgi:hypothetical protein